MIRVAMLIIVPLTACTVHASVLSFEEVYVPDTGTHYFAEVGNFAFSDQYIGGGTSLSPRGGIGLTNAATHPLPELAYSLPNSAWFDDQFMVTATLLSGGAFDFVGAYFGKSGQGGGVPSVFALAGYRDGAQIYSVSLIPDLIVAGGQLRFSSFNWTAIDRLDIRSRYNQSGSMVMDNLTYNVVPDPAAAWLLGSALGALGWLNRKAR